MEETKTPETQNNEPSGNAGGSKIKTRQGSGYLKQLYSTARVTAGATHSNLKGLTTFLVNFIPVDKVDASELQVRSHFDDSEVAALAQSIKLHGVLQPILVVQDGERYKVIAGERRLRASKLAGLDRIPARVLMTDDKATHEIALRENLDRVDLHPIEEGEGYVSLLSAKSYASHDEIAQAFGKPKSRITECIGFTKLPELTKQQLIANGVKNRALLRRLLNSDPATHLSAIEESVKVERGDAAFLLPSDSVAAATAESTAKAKAEKKEKPAFAFQVNAEKGVVVPGFKWKPGQGKEALELYKDALYKLIEEVEAVLKP